MPVFKFRVFWEDDDNIFRDIVLKSGQTFHQFHEAILKAFEFNKPLPASFYRSNDNWLRGMEISSEVLVNKKDAPALAMIKTPVSALIDKPDECFIYTYDPVKNWTFLINLIAIDKDEADGLTYPLCTKKEGLAPAQTQIKGMPNERLLEIEEKYDLNKENMDEEGYGDEGEEQDSDQEEPLGGEAEADY